MSKVDTHFCKVHLDLLYYYQISILSLWDPCSAISTLIQNVMQVSAWFLSIYLWKCLPKFCSIHCFCKQLACFLVQNFLLHIWLAVSPNFYLLRLIIMYQSSCDVLNLYVHLSARVLQLWSLFKCTSKVYFVEWLISLSETVSALSSV